MKYDQTFRDTGYDHTILTSYEFDPTVFENVALPGLATAGVRDVTVIIDTDRANLQFTEYGPPTRAGREYHLAKRKVTGSFHPKMVLQAGEKKARLMVGSANLTGSGLMGNLEAVAGLVALEDDLWAAPLIRTARDYIDRHIAEADRAGREALLRFDTKARWLEDVDPAREVLDPQGYRHGLLHENEDESIADQLGAFVGDDDIKQLVLISPFWNANLGAITELRGALGDPKTGLVLNPGNHPITAESLEAAGCTIHDASLIPDANGRRLHAKMLIACGAQADYIMTGSANMTREGLYARSGGPGNAEMCLIRTEDPGTAIERMNLNATLSSPIDISNHPPTKDADIVEPTSAGPRDGGSFEVQLGYVTWRPPTGVEAEGCQVVFFGKGDAELDVLAPNRDGRRYVMAAGHFSEPPRRARVVFPDGEMSAPTPIADVDGLARIGHGRLSATQVKMLEEIKEARSFDSHAFELATRLRAIIDAERAQQTSKNERQGETGGGGRKKDSFGEEEPQALTRDEFLGIRSAKQIEMDDISYRDSALGEVHRIISSILGLGLETQTKDEDEEVEVAIEDLMPDDEENEDRDNDQEQTERPPEGGTNSKNKNKYAPPQRKPKTKTKESKRSPAQVEKQLSKFIIGMREEIGEEAVDILSMRNAMSLRMVVFATLNEAAPVDVSPTDKHPMPARGTIRSSGWISLLGGLIASCRDKLPVSAALVHRLDRERIDCLATLLFAGGILADAAKEGRLPAGVQRSFQELHAELGRIMGQAMTDKPEAAEYLSKVLLGLERVYSKRRLAPTYS